MAAFANSVNNVGARPLHAAAKSGNACLVEVLLNFGAGVNYVNNAGRIALHYATEKGNYTIGFAQSHLLSSADELIAHNKELVKRATLALPRAFGNLPKTLIEVVPLEDFRQKHAPVAYYYEAPSDATRPAYFYLNTYQPVLGRNLPYIKIFQAIPL